MAASSLLFRNGTILQHGSQDEVTALRDTDMLVTGARIEKIGKDLKGPEGCRVFNCREKIICPGFIDTHHHVWQTQLKGRHSDDTLLDYTSKGNQQCFNYEPEDVFWGELAGCLEALDAGTTCVVDHAHMTYTPNHAFAGLSSTIASGIRSVFCYSIIPRFKRWDTEVEADEDSIPEWALPQLKTLMARQPFANGRVTVGFGFDMLSLPRDQVVALYQTVRNLGVKTLTSHWRKNNLAGTGDSVPKILHDYSLLGPDILLSHATGTSDSDFKLLQAAGAFVSSTPATESQMAHGETVCFRSDVNASLGADCHSANSSSMIHAMQIGLAVARAFRNEHILSRGRFPLQIEPRTLEAFNLATICGAKAIGMKDEIGSLQVGKKADLIIFSTDTPAMACAFDEDPLVAVVRHASTKEVDMVVVDGKIRKERGKLVDVDIEVDGARSFSGAEFDKASAAADRLSLKDISVRLRQSRERIQKRIQNRDLEAAREKTLEQWGATDPEKVFV